MNKSATFANDKWNYDIYFHDYILPKNIDIMGNAYFWADAYQQIEEKIFDTENATFNVSKTIAYTDQMVVNAGVSFVGVAIGFGGFMAVDAISVGTAGASGGLSLWQ